MSVAVYYGDLEFGEPIDYTKYYEWIETVKEDFRKFKSYILVNYEVNENFNKLIEFVEKNIDNKRPYDEGHVDGIFVGQNYSIISYPAYFDEKCDQWQSNFVIISRDYRLFVFCDDKKYNIFELKNGKIIEEELPAIIKYCWDDKTADDNICCIRNLRKSVKELGGFAEDENAVDGDYRDFNKCLAQEYFKAMKNEDFDALGDMETSLFYLVVFWLNQQKYNGEYKETIPTGNFKTNNGRLFYEAVIENKNGDLAETLIVNGNRSLDLFVIAIVHGTYGNLKVKFDDLDKYKVFVGKVLEEINDTYLGSRDCDRIKLMIRIKPRLARLKVYEHINEFNCEKYRWLNFVIREEVKKYVLET